jgi:hypothetical protein
VNSEPMNAYYLRINSWKKKVSKTNLLKY